MRKEIDYKAVETQITLEEKKKGESVQFLYFFYYFLI